MTSKQKEIAKLIFSIVLNVTIIGLIVFLLIQFAWKKICMKNFMTEKEIMVNLVMHFLRG